MEIDVLKGKILTDVKVLDDVIYLSTSDGKEYEMYHAQDCCEQVYVESVVGDIQDLIGEPLQIAEEVSSFDFGPKEGSDESYTWTFYKFATRKGYVDIRWYGSSNGYYSEEVSFREVNG